MTILLAGGTGNLGSFIAQDLAKRGRRVRVLVHRRPLSHELAALSGIEQARGDLMDPDSLRRACAGAGTVISAAGVLFRPHPERFLRRTNVEYVRHLATAARDAGAKKFILMSFPHVEGETTPENPATDRLDRDPVNVHFRTRLEAEKVLLGICAGSGMTPVILRAGTVYGRGVKMIEAAKRLLRWRMLAVWPETTWIHLIALPDFLAAMAAAVTNEAASGIYNIADDEPMTIQNALDMLADECALPRPLRLPRSLLMAGAVVAEETAALLGTSAPLTREFLNAGFVSSVADNSRMKRELVPALRYPSIRDGIVLLK